MSKYRWIQDQNHYNYVSDEDEIVAGFTSYPGNYVNWNKRSFLSIDACKRAIEKYFRDYHNLNKVQ